MKLSIVVPTYNRALLTKDCIRENIKNAGVPAEQLEWIWVDDGSTDGVKEVMRKLCPDISIERNYNLGIEKTVNQGYALATGDYIFKMDNDFLLPQDWAKKMIEYLTAIPETDAIGIRLAQYEQRNWSGKEEEINGLPTIEALEIMGFYGFSRAFFKKIGYLNDDIFYYASSDFYWSARAKKAKAFMYYIAGIQGLHLGHSNMGTGLDVLDPDREKKDEARRLNRKFNKEQQKILDKIYYNPYI